MSSKVESTDTIFKDLLLFSNSLFLFLFFKEAKRVLESEDRRLK